MDVPLVNLTTLIPELLDTSYEIPSQDGSSVFGDKYNMVEIAVRRVSTMPPDNRVLHGIDCIAMGRRELT